MKKIIILSILSFLVISNISHAESGSGDNRPDRPGVEMRRDLKDQRSGIKEDFKTQRDAIKTERKETHDQIKANREETKEKIKTLKEEGKLPEAKAEIEKMRSENKALRENLHIKMEAKREEIKKTFQTKIANFKENKKVLKEERKGVVMSHLSNISTRLETALVNISNFNTKLSEIIGNKKSKGLDTTTAEANLLKAEEALAEAKTKVDTAVTAVKEAVSSQEGVSKEGVRAVIDEAVSSLKTAREASRTVVTSLPKQEVEEGENN